MTDRIFLGKEMILPKKAMYLIFTNISIFNESNYKR